MSTVETVVLSRVSIVVSTLTALRAAAVSMYHKQLDGLNADAMVARTHQPGASNGAPKGRPGKTLNQWTYVYAVAIQSGSKTKKIEFIGNCAPVVCRMSTSDVRVEHPYVSCMSEPTYTFRWRVPLCLRIFVAPVVFGPERL